MGELYGDATPLLTEAFTPKAKQPTPTTQLLQLIAEVLGLLLHFSEGLTKKLHRTYRLTMFAPTILLRDQYHCVLTAVT